MVSLLDWAALHWAVLDYPPGLTVWAIQLKEDHVTTLFLVSLIFTRMAYEGFQEMSMFLQQKVSSLF